MNEQPCATNALQLAMFTTKCLELIIDRRCSLRAGERQIFFNTNFFRNDTRDSEPSTIYDEVRGKELEAGLQEGNIVDKES